LTVEIYERGDIHKNPLPAPAAAELKPTEAAYTAAPAAAASDPLEEDPIKLKQS
jgi:hypothetical protein